MRRIILKDLLYGVGLAVLIYVVETRIRETFHSLNVVLLIIVLVTVWLHNKTYSQAVKNLVSVVRVLQVPVIISFLGLGVAFYVNRYNTGLLVFVMLLASLGSVGLSYKLLLDWTVELKNKKKIDIKKYSKTLLSIAGLWLVAEGILLFMSI
jgi:hypothetical protein